MARIASDLSLPVHDNTRENDKRREFSRTIYDALSSDSRRAVGRFLDAAKRRKKRRKK